MCLHVWPLFSHSYTWSWNAGFPWRKRDQNVPVCPAWVCRVVLFCKTHIVQVLTKVFRSRKTFPTSLFLHSSVPCRVHSPIFRFYKPHRFIVPRMPHATGPKEDSSTVCKWAPETKGSSPNQKGFSCPAESSLLVKQGFPSSPVRGLFPAVSICWWVIVFGPGENQLSAIVTIPNRDAQG